MLKNRKCLPQLAYLIDLLSIVTLKSIKLGCNNPEKKKSYEEEAHLIMHDINLLLKEKKHIKDLGMFVRAIQMIMLANELIWSNETLARQGGRDQDHLLPFTHSVNTLRMLAGNVLSYQLNERKDLNENRLVDEVCIKRGYDFSKIFD